METETIKVFFDSLEQINDTISAGKVYIAYEGKNKKKFEIPEEAFIDAIPTLIGTPVVAYYFDDGQIGGHKGDIVDTNQGFKRTGEPIPFGFVAQDYEPNWVKLADGKDYLCAKVYIWTTRYPKAMDILSSDQSMEIMIESMKVVNGYKRIEKFKFLGICALSGISPTFELSKFVEFSDDNLIKQLEIMKEEFNTFTKGEIKSTPAKPNEKIKEHKVDENFTIDKGVDDSLKISTDNTKLIEGTVGKKDISTMKRKIVKANNYKEIIPKIFARYPENLDDFNMDDIGYPLMSEKDGMFYYNTGFIKAASSRIEQNKNMSYYEKVKKNIMKARKAVGMPKQFSEEGFMLNEDMMRKAGMAMYEKFGGKYMPYAMDEKYVYAMDTEKDMAKMKVPYAMKEDMVEMAYDKIMPMDYVEKEKAIKGVMGYLNEILMKMKKEKMAVDETYSTTNKELTDVKKECIDLKESVEQLKLSLDSKDDEIKNLKESNAEFSKKEVAKECSELLNENQKYITDEDFSLFEGKIQSKEYEKFSDFESEIIKKVYDNIHSDKSATFSNDEDPKMSLKPIIGFDNPSTDKPDFKDDWENLANKYEDQI